MENIVDSKRIVYTPSNFAKENLVYLQETGQLQSLKKHTSSREYMDSFLFLIVINGSGELIYEGNSYSLNQDSCAFIDCHKHYSHSSDNWNIIWIHFNGNSMNGIYSKYIERNGKTVFKSGQINEYISLLNEIYQTAGSNDHIRDMNINQQLNKLLSFIMTETVYEEKRNNKYQISEIKNYLDINYSRNITLEQLSDEFYINRFYLTRLFKNSYGMTINTYLQNKRVTEAKKMLRFTDLSIEDIAVSCGIDDANYFSRVFKKTEGISPKQYRKMW